MQTMNFFVVSLVTLAVCCWGWAVAGRAIGQHMGLSALTAQYVVGAIYAAIATVVLIVVSV